jgi:hypothetical protein
MMRLVFLFFAEERDLLPMTNPVYRENYAVSTLHDQLREAADRLGEEVLERRYDAFPRLLATFRAVHGGVEHDLAALPAYGGDLFDPDRFPFLEGRTAGTDWHKAASQPCPIHNRTVLHLLQALQFLEIKVPGGWEKRRLSFRALDIEQIGHVYEGLLDHAVRRATEIVLSLEGKEAPEITLSELVRRCEQPGFIEWLADETGRTAKAIAKSLKDTSINDPLRWPDWAQVSRFAALVRRDDNGDPGITPAGSLYVTAGTARRQTGTQYTPRTLTESVVEHALAPQVYVGPAEGLPPEKWLLKSAAQILSLKVCDFACGSAAFLVAAARYLSSRLMEAWEESQKRHGVGISITPYGDASRGLPNEDLIPSSPDERGLYALRVVVERCLYGVDRNRLAVEMAKLSLWLLTLQRNKPFTFLDHAIRGGDSLLGVDLKQLSTWSLSGEGKQSVLFNDDLAFAADKREGLMKMQYHPADQQRMLEAALAKTRRLRAAADLLIATAFEPNPDALAGAVSMGLDYQESEAQKVLKGRHPFHWPVEFPEVFLYGGGFDAIVGNPPFMGGSKISQAFGEAYRRHISTCLAGRPGNADYVAFFFLRALALLRPSGSAGLIATNTIAQGDTREIGLDQLAARKTTIFRAISSEPWPGDATLEVARIWFYKGQWEGTAHLGGREVRAISSQLTEPGNVSWRPVMLRENKGKSFNGTYVHGMGFVLTPETAAHLLDRDPRNAEVVMPYLNGEDLNSRWDQSASRWVINFHDWPLDRAESYPDCMEVVRRLVWPERQKLADGNPTARDLAKRWWQFKRLAADMYRAVGRLERVLVRTQTSRTQMGVFVPKGWVYGHKLIVFASSDCSVLALLDSNIHYCWVIDRGSTMRADAVYTTSDCFETFPQPDSVTDLERIGSDYEAHRRQVMTSRNEGLTQIYNRFHNQREPSQDIAVLRDMHVEIDNRVAASYGWTNLNLGHDFHQTKQGIRYTISEAARREVLDRLLALNQERYAQEQTAAEAGSKPKPKARKRSADQPALF